MRRNQSLNIKTRQKEASRVNSLFRFKNLRCGRRGDGPGGEELEELGDREGKERRNEWEIGGHRLRGGARRR